MWDPFINAVNQNFANAESLVAFDRFHVSQHFGKALNKVRAKEHQDFNGGGFKSPLKHSKYQWLKNSNRTDNRVIRRKEFMKLTRLNLKTARAWRIKETASTLWDYSYIGVAETSWKNLLGWISRCRLEPIRLKVNNSMLEAKNACIQRIKKIACGFRNRDRFKTAILFHLGGLDLHPFPTR